jgi:hypothetical protein
MVDSGYGSFFKGDFGPFETLGLSVEDPDIVHLLTAILSLLIQIWDTPNRIRNGFVKQRECPYREQGEEEETGTICQLLWCFWNMNRWEEESCPEEEMPPKVTRNDGSNEH